jgi:hypothetical protein
MSDIRLLPNGRMLGVLWTGIETTLNGQVAWMSPPEIYIHHELVKMPNGNYLTLGQESQDVTIDSVTKEWLSDRVLEFDRSDNSIVWEWSTIAHLSTLDYDQDEYDNSAADWFDWTHGNSVVYFPSDDSIYISLRSMNRIVRIDYTSKQIVYSLASPRLRAMSTSATISSHGSTHPRCFPTAI